MLLSFDADWRTNPHVARALAQTALALVKAGYELQVEDWDTSLGKGIDDLLAAGNRPSLKSVAFAFSAVLRGQHCNRIAPLRTIGAEEVRPWHSSL